MDRKVSPGWTTYSVEPAGTTAVPTAGEGAVEGDAAATAAGDAAGETVPTTIVGRPPAAPSALKGPPCREPRLAPTAIPITAATSKTTAPTSHRFFQSGVRLRVSPASGSAMPSEAYILPRRGSRISGMEIPNA